MPEVVKAARLSRRPLERAFSRHVGRSIHEEILRVRMNRAVELLTQSGQTVAAISEAAGFASANHLFRVFRRLQGTSPDAYRRSARSRSSGA